MYVTFCFSSKEESILDKLRPKIENCFDSFKQMVSDKKEDDFPYGVYVSPNIKNPNMCFVVKAQVPFDLDERLALMDFEPSTSFFLIDASIKSQSLYETPSQLVSDLVLRDLVIYDRFIYKHIFSSFTILLSHIFKTRVHIARIVNHDDPSNEVKFYKHKYHIELINEFTKDNMESIKEHFDLHL